MAAKDGESGVDGGGRAERASESPTATLSALELAVLGACEAQEEWPAQIAAGVYAGIDYVIAHADLARDYVTEATLESAYESRYEWLVDRFTSHLRARAPISSRLPAATDEALVAGIVGLVGDHVRIGRLDRLAELRPELVQLVLLPYLGFAESQRWANRFANEG